MDNWIWHTERVPVPSPPGSPRFLGSPLLVELVKMILAASILAGFVSLTALSLVWVERKVAAHVQQRLAPMRVGPARLFQTLATASSC